MRSTLVLLLLWVACTRSNLDAVRAGASADAASDGSVERNDRDQGSAGPDLAQARADGARDGAVSSVVCPTPALKVGDLTQTVQVGGVSRSYVLHVPSVYDGSEPVPLLLDFHAIGGSGKGERSSSPYPSALDGEGVIMAFPTGLSGPAGTAWNVGPCCVSSDIDDVAFARAVVTDVEAVACIDPKRVFAVGVSMGGGMAYYLACHAADVFAAVAPSAFDLLQEELATCKPSRPITVISFRGTADPIVSYAGGASSTIPGMPVTFLGAQGTFRAWADLDQCTDAASAADGNGCSTYANCQDDVTVTLCSKQGGGLEFGDPAIAWPVLLAHPMP